MLLKQSNPEHATNAGMSPRSLSPSEPTPVPMPHIDPLDDVFGSDDSPVFEQDFDDNTRRQDLSSHPSDIHRLQQEHTTAGYRDGIATAKTSSVQSGFDEGFGLGGTIGLKVGRLLGLLEGIVGALGAAADQAASADELDEATKLLGEAGAELDLRSMFSQTYWNADGTWKYEVEEEEGQDDEGAVVFSHVAEAHPLLKKWTATVEAQMVKWGVQEQHPLLQRRDDQEKALPEPSVKPSAASQSQGEAKAASDALSW